MSKITKWVVALVVILVVLFLLWKVVTPGTPASSQSAAVINSIPVVAANPALDSIKADIANVDSQMQGISSDLLNIGTTTTQAKIVATANHLKLAVSLMMNLRTKLSSSISNVTTPALSASMKTTLNDMAHQISNASSQVAVIVNNTSSIKPDVTTSTNTTLKQALVQLKTTQTYLQTVRSDVGMIVAGLH